MSDETTKPIESVPEFLVHAIELEHESAERYEQLADSMEIHHNTEVAELFGHLAGMSAAHASDVEALAVGVELPSIAPWDLKWHCPGSPETCVDADVDYLMSAKQAIEVALHNEIRGRDFYAHVASSAPLEDVRRLAGEMAEEENEHVELLKDWLGKETHLSTETPEDLDPPNMPE